MLKKLLRILMVIVIILGFVVGGIIIWKWKKTPNSSSEKTDGPKTVKKCFKCNKFCGNSLIKKNEKIYCSRKCADNGNGGGDDDNKNNGGKEKDLAEKIKNHLKEKINQAKNGSQETTPFSKRKDCIIWTEDDLSFIKDEEKIFPGDIGVENYQEIVNLSNQIKIEREKWVKQRAQEADQKLANDPNLFYNAYEVNFTGTNDWPYWETNGEQKGQKFNLVIPKNHPVFNNFSFSHNHTLKYYRITGTENIPLVPSPLDGTGFFKFVKLENQITIKFIEEN